MKYQAFLELYAVLSEKFAGDQQAALAQSARLRTNAERLGGADWANRSISALLCELYAKFGDNTEGAWAAFQVGTDSAFWLAESATDSLPPDC